MYLFHAAQSQCTWVYHIYIYAHCLFVRPGCLERLEYHRAVLCLVLEKRKVACLLAFAFALSGSDFHEVIDTREFLNTNFFEKEDWDALDARENPHWDPLISSDWADDSPQALEQLLCCEQVKDVCEAR